VTASSLSPEQEQAAISAETDRLFQWSMNDDAESLSRILADLNHPEKEVRLAAIEATKQFGSREAIPALKAAVANTQDTEEQMELLAAADFLSLPTIAENDIPLQKPLGQIQPAAPKRNLTHQHDPK
jgi:HEAT repeat protein